MTMADLLMHGHFLFVTLDLLPRVNFWLLQLICCYGQDLVVTLDLSPSTEFVCQR